MTNQQNVVYREDVLVTMRGVSDSVGLPYTVNPIELVDREVLIELREGPTGSQGRDGDPAWPWLWQGDIADRPALQALRLTTADARKAWRVVAENAIYFWTGLEFVRFTEAFARKGRQGAPNILTGSGLAGPAGSSASAQITGTAPGQQLTITFPRGVTGDIGDPGKAGRIQDAADVLIDDDHPLGQDYVLGWNAALGKFTPIPSPRVAGPWAIGKGQLNGGNNLNADTKVVGSITIPGQPTTWRPYVNGLLIVGTTNNGTRCDVQIRMGAPDGDIVAAGNGYNVVNWAQVQISPRFPYPMTPQSTYGVVQPNQTTTLYVVVTRAQGTGTYYVDTEGAQLVVNAQPV
ncbi:hypothetical protein [Nocardia sp. NPDC020380]|uniref:hypothetical protein n=1 Tax=Nocardia sp. NPDC020380 TaxID=3364309 RepID=UPI0037BC8E83